MPSDPGWVILENADIGFLNFPLEHPSGFRQGISPCTSGLAGGYVNQNTNIDIGTSTASVINMGGTQALFANNFFRVTYSLLRGGVGDGSPTVEFPMKLKVVNTRTGSDVGTADAGTVTSTDTSAPGASHSFTVTEKTPYVAIYHADVTEWGLDNPIATWCFMTGGTYTIINLSIENGSNGCFSISLLTPLDARNCLCGRGATGSVTINEVPVAYDYTSIRSNWGCDPAG